MFLLGDSILDPLTESEQQVIRVSDKLLVLQAPSGERTHVPLTPKRKTAYLLTESFTSDLIRMQDGVTTTYILPDDSHIHVRHTGKQYRWRIGGKHSSAQGVWNYVYGGK